MVRRVRVSSQLSMKRHGLMVSQAAAMADSAALKVLKARLLVMAIFSERDKRLMWYIQLIRHRPPLKPTGSMGTVFI